MDFDIPVSVCLPGLVQVFLKDLLDKLKSKIKNRLAEILLAAMRIFIILNVP